jgi:hypothetical protein
MLDSQGRYKYSFSERNGFSRGVARDGDIASVLRANIPNATNVIQATLNDDKHGTDYWVQRLMVPALSVDIKTRDVDPITQYKPPRDDLALETYSDVTRQTIGWTRDPNKRTDYILWYFTPTKRWVLVPFPMLCSVFIDKWQQWRSQYQTAQQRSSNGHTWISECVFVPRVVVWREIFNRYGGHP